MVPTSYGNTCRPNTASTFGFSSTPSLIISAAPPSSPGGGPSSAGWKMNLTVPGSCSRIPARSSATLIRIATWASCPQACMTPTSCPLYCDLTVDLNGRSTSSATGSASMSARSATTGPGRPPRSMPTTPVFATPVLTSMPSVSQVVGDQLRRPRLRGSTARGAGGCRVATRPPWLRAAARAGRSPARVPNRRPARPARPETEREAERRDEAHEVRHSTTRGSMSGLQR